MIKGERESLARSILRYSSSTIYRQLLGIVNAFVKPRFLAPEYYGLWQLLNLIPDYASNSHLGARSSMRYLIPLYQASNETDKIEPIKSAAFYGGLVINLVIFGVVVAVALLGGFNLPTRAGLITMAVLVLLGTYVGYGFGTLSAYHEFRLISRALYLKATVGVFLGALLLYRFGVFGLFVSSLVATVLVALYLRPHCPLPRRDQFRFSLFCDLVRKGFPIMAITLTDMLLCTSDRLILSCYVDKESLGYYGIAITATTFVMQIPGASREVIEPRMMESFGMGLHGESLDHYLSTPLVYTSLFMPLLVGLMMFFVSVFIPALLPRYTPGIASTQILLCGTQSLALAYLLRGVIIANDWQLSAVGIMAVVLLVNVILSVLLLHAGWGISAVAIGTAVSFLLLFIALFSLVAVRAKQLRYDWKQDCRLLLLTVPALTVANAVPVYLSSYWNVRSFLSAASGLGIVLAVWLGVWTIARHLHPALAETSLWQLVKGIRA